MLLMTNGTLNNPKIQEGQYFKNKKLINQAAILNEADRDTLLRGLAFKEIKQNGALS